MKRLSTIARIAALAGLMALPVPARAALYGYNAIGTGTESDNCPGSSEICTIEMTTGVRGALGSASYAKAAFDVTLTVVISEPIANGFSSSFCYPASGTGTIAGLPGGAVNLSTVGMLCDMGASGSPQGYNGTYFVTGGAAKNAKASGTGNVSASMEPSNRLILSIFGVIQR